MTDRGTTLAQRAFWPLLALGAMDRLLLLFLFGFRYVGDDDGVIWSAAKDYGHGLFREPYFYGQDYAVMLEALIAAPFARIGMPLHILMPLVTSCSALVPFWSFALWHRKHGRASMALLFIAMPILLPVVHGMITTMTRCFVPGIALLAFLPWVLDVPRAWPRSLLIGLTVSAAAYVNPNSVVFSAAFVAWHLLTSVPRWPAALALALGALPFLTAQMMAQVYCNAHPERMMNGIFGWRMTVHPRELVPESMGMLNSHFAWLFPVLSGTGSLVLVALIMLVVGCYRNGAKSTAAGLLCALILIIVSFAFPKTHDGTDNAFFPYARMYLAMPLLICWGLAAFIGLLRLPRTSVLALCGLCAVCVVVKRLHAPAIIEQQLAAVPEFVHELPLHELERDALRLKTLANEHQVGAMVGNLSWKNRFAPQFRCYLEPLLEGDLPPTYLAGNERRYWRRDELGGTVVPNVMLVGGSAEQWAGPMRTDPHLLDVSDAFSGQLHILSGITLPVDSVVARCIREQEGP